MVTYGGVSLFVASFVLSPMAQSLLQAANIPGGLQLAGMRAAYDEIVSTGTKRQQAFERVIDTASQRSSARRFGKVFRPAPAQDSELACKMPQRGAQALLEDRVVKGHRQSVLCRHPLLYRPSNQVRHVLHPRAEHLSAKQSTAAELAIESHKPTIACHHSGPTLILV
jgi:hypothetical protein